MKTLFIPFQHGTVAVLYDLHLNGYHCPALDPIILISLEETLWNADAAKPDVSHSIPSYRAVTAHTGPSRYPQDAAIAGRIAVIGDGSKIYTLL